MHTIHYLRSDRACAIEADPASVFGMFDPAPLSHADVEDPSVKNAVSTLLFYSVDHLYVLMKSRQTSITQEDRAYQNGDGFHFVLAKPNPSSAPTEEFLVIAISPLATDRRRQFIWYRNVDLAGKALKRTRTSHVTDDGEVTFMVRLPWDEIPPLKPFLFDTWGFNARYVQSVPGGKNTYTLKEDPNIDSEQSPREYAPYGFEVPGDVSEAASSLAVNRNHVTRGQNASLKYAVATPGAMTLRMSFTNGDRLEEERSIALDPGLNRGCLPIDKAMLDPGRNDLHVIMGAGPYEHRETFTLYHYDLDRYVELNERIRDLDDPALPEGLLKESVTTLMFQGRRLLDEIASLKPYDSFAPLEEAYSRLKRKVASVEAGRNVFDKGRFIRLAHQSGLDGSLQPYTLYIPKALNASTRLLVYLHGSGSDDRSVQSNRRFEELARERNLMILAPYARGTSHFYCTEASRHDIVEITGKIASLFDMDAGDTILSGFSMGGYGVYRVYDEAPSLFGRLVVISGHHSIGRLAGGPDYGSDETIGRFAGVPMILFHGTDDMNCPYEETKPFFNRLQGINPYVGIHVKDGLGHSGLTDEWRRVLSAWLSDDDA